MGKALAGKVVISKQTYDIKRYGSLCLYIKLFDCVRRKILNKYSSVQEKLTFYLRIIKFSCFSLKVLDLIKYRMDRNDKKACELVDFMLIIDQIKEHWSISSQRNCKRKTSI